MKRAIACGFHALWILTMAGCASEPSVGDRMISQGGDTLNLGQQWNEGRKLVSEGKDLVEEGEEQIEDGEELIDEGKDNIKEGKKMIRKGKEMMTETEKLYGERFPGRSLKAGGESGD